MDAINQAGAYSPFVSALCRSIENRREMGRQDLEYESQTKDGTTEHTLLDTTFITRMRRAGVEYSVAMALVGHTPVGETASLR